MDSMVPGSTRDRFSSTWTSAPVVTGLTVVAILAGVGFLLSFLSLLMSYAGKSLFGEDLTPILFPGVFVVWFPAVIVASRMTRFENRKDIWKITLSGCPKWMRAILWTICGLGAANFLYFVVLSGNKYEHGPSIQFAGGHLLIFYGTAFCVMYSALHAQKLLSTRHCPNGHVASPGDAYCPQCGESINTKHSDPSS